MKPILRRLLSPDVHDLRTFVPAAPSFAILVQLLVGPSDGPGEESFDVLVCSPEWLREQAKPTIGRHHLIVRSYDYENLVNFLNEYLQTCDGGDWTEVATKIGRLGRWEFEDYDSANDRT